MVDKFIGKILVFAETQDFLSLIKDLCCDLCSPCNEEMRKASLMHAMMLSLGSSQDVSAGAYNPEILLMEQICGAVIYGGKKGIPVNDIRRLVVVFLEALKKIISCESVPTPETAAQYLKKILQSNAMNLTRHGLLATTTYLLDVLIPNIHLYNYLMFEDWEVESHSDHLALHLVFELPPLSSGCLVEEWEKRKKLAEREVNFSKEKSEIISIKQELLKEETESVEQIYDGLLQQISSEEVQCKSLRGVISSATMSHTDYTAKELLLKVKDNEMDLEFEIDKIEILSPRKKQ